MMISKRIEYIDFLRAFATLLVILVHILSGRSIIVKWSDISFFESIVYALFYSIAVLGVPLFLFISGYLLLDRNYNKESVIRFYKKNYFHLYLVYVIWFIAYAIFENIVGDYSFTFYSALKILLLMPDLIVYDLIYSFHLWYLPMILKIYLFIPILAILLKKFSDKFILTIYFLYFMYVFIPPMLSVMGYSLNSDFILTFRFPYDKYFMYVLGGYFLKKALRTNIPNSLIITVFIVSFFSSVIMLVKSLYFHLPHDVLTVFVSAFTLMLVTGRYYKVKNSNFILNLSENSFAIYLVHLPILAMFYYAVFLPHYGKYFRLFFISFPIVTLFPIVIFLTNILVNYLRKSKFLSKYVLYMR